MKTLTMLFALMVASTSVMAGPHHRDRGHHVDYAKVISATPIYEWRTERGRRHYSRYDDRHDSAAAPVLGAIIGGSIGNAVGNNRSSKKVGAVAGAVLGAAIATDIQRRDRDDDYYEARHHRDHRYRVIVGYDVRYRYHGRTYYTRTNYDPGRRIKVHVDVRPVR